MAMAIQVPIGNNGDDGYERTSGHGDGGGGGEDDGGVTAAVVPFFVTDQSVVTDTGMPLDWFTGVLLTGQASRARCVCSE